MHCTPKFAQAPVLPCVLDVHLWQIQSIHRSLLCVYEDDLVAVEWDEGFFDDKPRRDSIADVRT